jgi:hypothetical protein
MMIEDIHKALDEGRFRHGAELFMALRHFLEHHPEARRGLAGDQHASHHKHASVSDLMLETT